MEKITGLKILKEKRKVKIQMMITVIKNNNDND